jgi:redox-sensitive bicupin YhaK (pirin superfamily)
VQTLRSSQDRGFADHGWLQSYHSFSFADYFDQHVGFGALRVINEDRVAPGGGFGTHPHRDMEIISYVLDGELEHQDSMGNGSVIRPGDVQRMSAGTGVQHSERNPSRDRRVHFLQIWIRPDRIGLKPEYEQKNFADQEKRGRLRLIVSGDGAEGSVRVHQDAHIYSGLFNGDEHAELVIGSARRAYVHVARGALTVNGRRLSGGDALTETDVTHISCAVAKTPVLVLLLPGAPDQRA